MYKFGELWNGLRSMLRLYEKCWMDEALREIDHQPIPLRIWSAALPLVLSVDLPSSVTQSNEDQKI